MFPSLGLNSVWVGGDENFGGFNSAFLSTFGKFYATRLSELSQPANTIVFGSARGQESSPIAGGIEGVAEGYFRIRSPSFDTRTWSAAYDADDPASWGNLSARFAGDIAVGFADGHAEARRPETLDDMRMWAPGAGTKDWTLTPGGG